MYEDRRGELKEMTIQHLKSCSGSGPKMPETCFHFMTRRDPGLEVSEPKRIVGEQ